MRLKVRGRVQAVAQQIARHHAKEAFQARHGARSTAGSSQSVKAQAPSVKVAQNERVLGQVGGGGGAQGGGAGAPQSYNSMPDAGEDLVELIQTVVAPKSWEANGGVGTIYYWRLQHAIVVRNTSEIHGEVSDVLDQLNRANH